MIKTILNRAATIALAGTTALCFGFVSQVSAASISDTGPGSINKIITTSAASCTVENNTHISNSNNTNQNAKTGDATASNNTTVGGDAWGSWDPAVWQAQGHSYAEWHAAFTAYMASQEGNWSSDWDNMGGSAGGVTTGNATNNNSTTTAITVDNGGASASASAGTACSTATSGMGGGQTNPTTPGQGGQVLGESTSISHSKGVNGVLGVTTSQTQGGGGSTGNGNETGAGVSNNPGAGGNGGGNGGNGPAPVVVNNTISDTGPGSNNVIVNKTSSTTHVSNNTNISNNNSTNQSSSTGNSTSSYNTTVGGGNTGDGGNTAGTNTKFDVNN